jgi:hypothetical protein
MPSIPDQLRSAARLGARARAPTALGFALALLAALAMLVVLALRPPAGPGHAGHDSPALPAERSRPAPDRSTSATTSQPGSPRPAATPQTPADPRADITARLREILRVREEAFARRDMRLLETVYMADCPCLLSGRAAIAQLLTDGAVWRDRAVTVEVTGLERSSDRVWVAAVLFSSRGFRIEREDGGLIRAVPAERRRYRLVLARPAPGDPWLVGDTAPLPGGLESEAPTMAREDDARPSVSPPVDSGGGP